MGVYTVLIALAVFSISPFVIAYDMSRKGNRKVTAKTKTSCSTCFMNKGNVCAKGIHGYPVAYHCNQWVEGTPGNNGVIVPSSAVVHQLPDRMRKRNDKVEKKEPDKTRYVMSHFDE